MRQVVLDTETTGLEAERGHRIIEIGGVELVDRRYSGKQFHKYINPERDIDEGAQEVHGITAEFLADKPRIADIWAEFIEFIAGAELVIHNAPFDVGFLDAEIMHLKELWEKEHENKSLALAKEATRPRQLTPQEYAKIEQILAIIEDETDATKKRPSHRNSTD